LRHFGSFLIQLQSKK